MRLVPYVSLARRRQKVCKHVFNHRERWWEVFGDLIRWHQDYTVLRGAGCFLGPEGWRAVEGRLEAELVADRAHDEWLAAAESACAQASEAGRVYPADEGRQCYVGDLGVTVYVAKDRYLATCFRPGRLGSRRSVEAVVRQAERRARHLAGRQAAEGAITQRAAVRRAHRRASLRSNPGAKP